MQLIFHALPSYGISHQKVSQLTGKLFENVLTSGWMSLARVFMYLWSSYVLYCQIGRHLHKSVYLDVLHRTLVYPHSNKEALYMHSICA